MTRVCGCFNELSGWSISVDCLHLGILKGLWKWTWSPLCFNGPLDSVDCMAVGTSVDRVVWDI